MKLVVKLVMWQLCDSYYHITPLKTRVSSTPSAELIKEKLKECKKRRNKRKGLFPNASLVFTTDP
jgi:hypothetical protein